MYSIVAQASAQGYCSLVHHVDHRSMEWIMTQGCRSKEEKQGRRSVAWSASSQRGPRGRRNYSSDQQMQISTRLSAYERSVSDRRQHLRELDSAGPTTTRRELWKRSLSYQIIFHILRYLLLCQGLLLEYRSMENCLERLVRQVNQTSGIDDLPLDRTLASVGTGAGQKNGTCTM